jgi:thioredoxin 1
MPNITYVEDPQFENEVLKSAVPVAAMFKSEWCPSCKRLWPLVEKFSDEYKDKFKFVHVDIMKSVKSTAESNVLAIPTIAVFKNGKETERLTGYVPEAELKAFLEKNL